MAVRGASCFARWEGAEFIALFRGKTAAEAAVQVEHALQVLRRVDFRAGEPEPLLLTFSAGVSDLLVGGNFDDAMASADRLRDAAKHAGRNRVISALPDDGLPKRRILLAEDDPDVVRILTRHLQREGFEVLHCANGRLALETAPMAGVAAIISDIEMPELNGLGFLEGVRAHPMLKHVPMMMLTAVGAEDVIVRAFELGADDYVTKPFVVREVVARVRRLLRRPSVSAVALALEA
jgi:PleD family two-component response regulator